MNREVLTVREVSKYLRIKPRTIYRLAKKKEIPCIKIGGQWRFNRDTIRGLMGMNSR